MNKLSKEKRNQLIMVILLTGGILAGLYFGLISSQNQSLKELDDQRKVAQGKRELVQRAIRNAAEIETNLMEQSSLLAIHEDDMATGGLYLWMINFITKFKTGYHVEIPQFAPAVVSDVNLLPKFPYKQVSVSISGTGYYHDIGKFVADFENRFPSARVLNLELSPGSPQGNEEKLSFKMDIVTLIKSES